MFSSIILDLYCCTGGASRGYAKAGFSPVGVDISDQPKYPYPFAKMDALTALDTLLSGGKIAGYMLEDIDAIHASPPCQGFSSLSVARGDGTQHNYVNMIPATVERLERTGKPWIVENVIRAPLDANVILCGTQFGLNFRWHRKFLTSFPVEQLPCDHAIPTYNPFTMKGWWRMQDAYGKSPNPEKRFRLLRGIDWTADLKEGREALPPVFAEYVGRQLLGNKKPPLVAGAG